MSKQQRHYTREFKAEAVRLVAEEGYTVVAAAKSLGIPVGNLYRWKQKFAAQHPTACSERGEAVSPDEEIRRLREENRRLRMERDILKKATAYFAKESQ